MAKSPEVIAHIDGASRGNPGPAAYGVVMESADGSRLAGFSGYLGKATNNVAEYQALLAALEYALSNHYLRVHVQTDSELLARQIEGVYKVKSPGLKPLQEQARTNDRAPGIVLDSSMCHANRIAKPIGLPTRPWTRRSKDGKGIGQKGREALSKTYRMALPRRSPSRCAPPPPFTKGSLNPTDSFRFSKAKWWIWKSTGRNKLECHNEW